MGEKIVSIDLFRKQKELSEPTSPETESFAELPYEQLAHDMAVSVLENHGAFTTEVLQRYELLDEVSKNAVWKRHEELIRAALVKGKE